MYLLKHNVALKLQNKVRVYVCRMKSGEVIIRKRRNTLPITPHTMHLVKVLFFPSHFGP